MIKVSSVLKFKRSLNFLTAYISIERKEHRNIVFMNTEFGVYMLRPAWATWRQYLFCFKRTKKHFWTKGEIIVCGFFYRWFGGHI